MKPFYFGAPDKPLFGIYNPPAAGAPQRGAVVLCYPFGPEYLRSHRALRELSHHLGQSGHHTLRFDYYGCGDSSGASDQGSVVQWLDDVARGVEELREASGLARVSLLGLRLGATLAAVAAAGDSEIDRLVLWDPVVHGSAYLDELGRRNRAYMQGRARPASWTESEPPDELLGTPVPDALRRGIAGLDLLALTRPPARRVLLVETEHAESRGDLREHLRRLAAPLDHEQIRSPPLWLKQDAVDLTLVPQDVIQRIAAWLDRNGA